MSKSVSATALRWVALVALSLALSAVLGALRMPGALLIGPMLAAIVLATRGHAVAVPPNAFVAAQGVIGMMIAGFLPLSIGSEIYARWPVFLFGTLSTLLTAAGFGWAMTRSRLLPGTTAIWGSSPGASTVMTLMSEQYGADLRLVALMQYLRVACCAAVAAMMARVLGTPAAAPALGDAATDLDPGASVTSLALALGGAALGRLSRIPAGPLLAAMALGLTAKATGLMTVTLPAPALTICYAFLGWGLGARFTPDVVSHAARVLPRVLLSIFALIAVCGVSGFLLVPLAGIDPLTAFLATSPGGADTASIIAATTQVDAPFVISMQMVRFFCVLITAPATARFLSRSHGDARL